MQKNAANGVVKMDADVLAVDGGVEGDKAAAGRGGDVVAGAELGVGERADEGRLADAGVADGDELEGDRGLLAAALADLSFLPGHIFKNAENQKNRKAQKFGFLSFKLFSLLE